MPARTDPDSPSKAGADIADDATANDGAQELDEIGGAIVHEVSHAIAGSDNADWARIETAWQRLQPPAPPGSAAAVPSLGALPVAPPPGAEPLMHAAPPRPMMPRPMIPRSMIPLPVPTPPAVAPAPRPVAPAMVPVAPATPQGSPATRAPRTPARPPRADLGGTLPMDSDKVVLARDVLPFMAGTGALPPSAAEDDRDDQMGATMAADGPAPAPSFPFDDQHGEVPASTTADVVDATIQAAMPFEQPSGPHAAEGDAAPLSGGYEPTERLSAADVLASLGGSEEVTMVVPYAREAPGSGSQPGLPEHLRAMTVDQYAGLCAECTVHPEWTEAIQQRYQVRGFAERSALDQSWRARMEADAQLADQWRWHYARYELWARNQHRG